VQSDAHVRTCPIKASGSSRHGFARRTAIRERYGHRKPGLKVPDRFPARGSATRRPLPSPGSRRLQFPEFGGTMGRSDSLRTVTTACPCRSPVVTPAGASVFVSPLKPDAGLRPGAFWVRPPPSSRSPGELQGVPSSWGTLMCLRPVLRPRRDRATRPYGGPTRPPGCQNRRLAAGSQSRGSIAGPRH
jgi:hypothetical protein